MTVVDQTSAASATSASAGARLSWQSQLGIAPGAVLRMVGMRRSGNHAISHWLQRNAPTGRAVFLNDCRAATDPLKSFRGFEISGVRIGAETARKDLPRATSAAGPGALLLISYEDTVHARFDAMRPLSGPRQSAGFDHDILVYRSFLNWSASLLKKMQRNPKLSVSDRMATAVRALATYSALLAEVDDAAHAGRIAICYDRWVSDASYRLQLLSTLGLVDRDNSLGPVQAYGGGSSFQEDAKAAGDLLTQTRWHEMAQDAEYHALLHVAVQDRQLLQRIDRAFPQDAARLVLIKSHTDASRPNLLVPKGSGLDAQTSAEGLI